MLPIPILLPSSRIPFLVVWSSPLFHEFDFSVLFLYIFGAILKTTLHNSDLNFHSFIFFSCHKSNLDFILLLFFFCIFIIFPFLNYFPIILCLLISVQHELPCLFCLLGWANPLFRTEGTQSVDVHISKANWPNPADHGSLRDYSGKVLSFLPCLHLWHSLQMEYM